jgi:hypothetical protein
VLLMTAFDNNDDTLLNMNMKYNNNISGIIQKPVSSAKLVRMTNGADKQIMFFWFSSKIPALPLALTLSTWYFLNILFMVVIYCKECVWYVSPQIHSQISVLIFFNYWKATDTDADAFPPEGVTVIISSDIVTVTNQAVDIARDEEQSDEDEGDEGGGVNGDEEDEQGGGEEGGGEEPAEWDSILIIS